MMGAQIRKAVLHGEKVLNPEETFGHNFLPRCPYCGSAMEGRLVMESCPGCGLPVNTGILSGVRASTKRE